MNVNVAPQADLGWLPATLARAEGKVQRMAKRLKGGFYHSAIPHGKYLPDLPEWWTSGFWPGSLWLVHQATGDKLLAEYATACEHGIHACLLDDRVYALHHDVGFQFSPTSVLRYKLTRDNEARRRGFSAANLLMSRFNTVTGIIEAWNGVRRDHSIIDTLINLPLLFWAAEEFGQPRFANLAKAHIETFLKHWIRPDGTTHHVIRFDMKTGEKVEALGGQGYAPESCWSRGQSWGVLGLPLAYRYTGDGRHRDAALKVAESFLNALPANGIPPWDFTMPGAATAPRDSSAAAIAACGFLELAELIGGSEGAFWRAAGADLTRKLGENVGLLDTDGKDGLIDKCTGKKPMEENVEVPIVYGDYYYLEALYRLKGGITLPW
jgi:unsaturated chondroitin disaccharide hydrolase